ncbi:dienelactone hydrolase family protein [Paracoccus sp. M683]|uniref:dienelactone hydrolase family protein n=1 Tax=Paracoccus sp. M683 TaxID=2594268 RepID=UPI001180AF07|nr:dienelactone hydrolase family protein [Paracoccus sp. M683]TRW95297.1 dienelactone hydrolase family protein [Paracoccus sp. M683]
MQTEDFDFDYQGQRCGAYAAWDDSLAGPLPGVLVIHDLWGFGEQPKDRARRLAAMGYHALAVDLYGDRREPQTLDEAFPLVGQLRGDVPALRKRLHHVLDMLAGRPGVDAGRLASIGFCLGGVSSLELARDGADLRAIVGFHCNLDTPLPAQKGQVRPSILICTGGDDPIIPQDQISGFMDEMRDAGADWQMNFYGGAGHNFTNNFADRAGIPGVAYQETADRRAWQALAAFFEENLR